MTDQELLEQAPALPLLYLDGFGAYRKLNGVLRCVGYTLELGAQVNLIVSLAGADQANHATRRILDQKTSTGLAVWHDLSLAH